ncbi:MAG: addiction module toxin RelE [Candidatus ainarchaeum sp.]|nr:addiction module toxin RelE [Candidatus ainarchaeum sp.]
MPFDYDFSPKLRRIIQKLVKNDRHRAGIIYNKVKEIINSDETTIEHYKNLRHDLSNQKRVHVDESFVLTFSFDKKKKFILFLDFDHHDNIYRR